MRRLFAHLLALLFFATPALAELPEQAAEQAQQSLATPFEDRVASTFIVVTSPGTDGMALLSGRGYKSVRASGQDAFIVVTHHPDERGTAMDAVRALPGVEGVEPDQLVPALFNPGDTNIGDQWQYYSGKINAYVGWDYSRGGVGVKVAVLDSGAWSGMPDLQDNVIDGYDVVLDVVFNTYNQTDYCYDSTSTPYHGTRVSTVLGAIGENSYKLAGVAYRSWIMPIRISETSGSGCLASLSTIRAGINKAVELGADIITISYHFWCNSSNYTTGCYWQNQIVNVASANAKTAGIPVFAAAGNTSGSLADPASGNIIVISGSDTSDNFWSISSYGNFVDFAGPAQYMRSMNGDGTIVTPSGTSYASPTVAGLAALIKSLDPGISVDDLYDLIKSGADDKGATGWDDHWGWGRIDVGSTLALMTAVNKATNVSGSYTPPGGGGQNPGTWVVSWTAASGAASYKVYKIGNDGYGRVTYLGSTTSTSFTYSDYPNPGKFAVVTVDSNGKQSDTALSAAY